MGVKGPPGVLRRAGNPAAPEEGGGEGRVGGTGEGMEWETPKIGVNASGTMQ